MQIDGQSYFIVPKIASKEQGLDNFIYMLLYAYEIKADNTTFLNAGSLKHKILDIFIEAFANELLKELKFGAFKQYVTMQENLKLLRGKYLIDKNLTNFYHQNVYCEFDEFSMDNELNRFFLFAIKTFKRYTKNGNLNRCEAILDEVSFFNINYKALNINFDRTNSRFKRAFDMAMLILKHLIASTNANNNKTFAFLFDMAEVFEKFVANIFKSIDNSCKIQIQKNFGSLVLKPDIVTSSCIIDTKYKKLNSRGDLLPQDKYQIFTYGINFNIRDCMLLYPKHLLDVENEPLELGKGENLVNLRLKSLDLGFKGGYREYISEMRERGKKLL